MKLVILAAIIAAVASTTVTQGQTWPWQVGKVYTYTVNSLITNRLEEGVAISSIITGKFIVSVKDIGHLQAKLENPEYISVKQNDEVKFQTIQNIDQLFDIFVDGGRVISINFPISLSIVNENLIKSFINALQVDVSNYGFIHNYPNNYQHEAFQGLFKKMEYDLYGECETMYSISPTSAYWREVLPNFTYIEDPIQITKTKNYGSCTKRIAYEFGIPEGAVWEGITKGQGEKQFIDHTTDVYLLVGKEGTIYRSELMSSVMVSPVVYGKQRAEVKTSITISLESIDEDKDSNRQKLKEFRSVNSLLYTVDNSWRLFTFGGENNVAKAQDILQNITPLLQNPSQMAKGDFLMQFNILVFILASMNSQQLAVMTSSTEIAKASKNVAKSGMWIIYRDALCESGTPAALEEIKSWILTKKIEGEEAANVIRALGSSFNSYSQAALTNFFNFATCPEVLQQKSLNSSALLAVSRLLRFSKDDQFIVETVIPRFSKELKNAVEKGESSKAQVYVRILGNLAHPGILKAFAPYLEGQVTVTKYLRTQIVTSLKTLANLKDKYVRSVLYSILMNTAEPYDIRVAAALNIFLAIPTPEMMRIMAHMTKFDPSTQVRAVLTNSITFAADLKEPRFAELARSAQSVMHIVSKEKFGYSYSTDTLFDEYTGDEDFSFFNELSYIGSDNILFPKYLRSALRFTGTAFGDERQITLSVSDVQELINYFASKIYEPSQSKLDFKFSAKKIIEILNIKRAKRQPIEAAIFVDNLNQQKLITFNAEELYAFIKNIMLNVEKLVTGVDYHFVKILRQNQVYIDFPLANGMSFTYQHTEPMIINAQVQSKVTFTDDSAKIGVLENEIHLTYARNIIGSVGFIDTIGEMLVGAGVINKLQVHIPAKIKTTFNFGEDFQVEFEPLHANNDINLIQFSVLPYTGTLKKDSTTYELNIIQRPPKTQISTDTKFGYLTGMYCHFYGHSYSSDYKNLDETYSADSFITNLGYMLYQKDIAFTEYNLKYLSKVSETRSISFLFYYDKLYNQNNSGKMGSPILTEHLEPNSEVRRTEMIKKASTGIDAAEVAVTDISVICNGRTEGKNKVLVFTGAYAESFVDTKSQVSLVANVHGYDQLSAVFQINTREARIVPLNLEHALKNEIRVTYDAKVKLGVDKSVQLHGYSERSDEYTEQLKNDPMAKSCLYQQDCHKMILMAHAPDYFKTIVKYRGFEQTIWPYLEALLYLKDELSWKTEYNPFVSTVIDQIDIEGKSFYYDNYDDYKITTQYGRLSINKVEGSWYGAYSSAVYTPTTPLENTLNYFTNYQYMPFCTVANTKIKTFSNRSYDYKLSSSWHVVMVAESDGFGRFDDLVILARRPSNKPTEVYVSYKTVSGLYVEVEIEPDSVNIKSDAKKTCEGALTMYWDDGDKDYESPLLEYYTVSDVKIINIGNRNLRLVYDNQTLVIFSKKYRSTTRGICGQNSGQTIDDIMTPWGQVVHPQLYGASFSLEDEFSDPKTVELKKEAKQKAYQPVYKYTKIYNADWWNQTLNNLDGCHKHQS